MGQEDFKYKTHWITCNPLTFPSSLLDHNCFFSKRENYFLTTSFKVLWAAIITKIIDLRCHCKYDFFLYLKIKTCAKCLFLIPSLYPWKYLPSVLKNYSSATCIWELFSSCTIMPIFECLIGVFASTKTPFTTKFWLSNMLLQHMVVSICTMLAPFFGWNLNVDQMKGKSN